METLRKFLSLFFRLLPVKPKDEEFTGTSERIRENLPSNFAAIAVNGFFFPTAGRILGAGLLLTWFVSDLSSSATLVSAIIPIQYGLSLIAQPYIAAWVSTRRERARYYTAQSLLRACLWIALGLAAYFIGGGQPVLMLVIFFAVIVIDAFAAGLGNIVFNDTLAKVIPPALRGRARSWRGVFGGIVAGIAGILIKYYFSEQSGLAAFGLLFAAAGAFYALGGLVFGLIEENKEDSAANSEKPRFSDVWRRIGEIWNKTDFRRFVYAESLLVPLMRSLPFFALFARRDFNLEIGSLGILITADAAAPIAGNFVWGRLADYFGNRFVMIVSAGFGLTAPLTGMFLFWNGDNGSSFFVVSLFAAVVFAVGAASAGIDLATKNYILGISPDEESRPFYIGVNDTLVGIPTTLLVAAGFVIDRFGFPPVFFATGALAVLGMFFALRLPEKKDQGDQVSEL